ENRLDCSVAFGVGDGDRIVFPLGADLVIGAVVAHQDFARRQRSLARVFNLAGQIGEIARHSILDGSNHPARPHRIADALHSTASYDSPRSSRFLRTFSYAEVSSASIFSRCS